MASQEQQTLEPFNRHVASFQRADISQVLSDFADDSIVYTTSVNRGVIHTGSSPLPYVLLDIEMADEVSQFLKSRSRQLP